VGQRHRARHARAGVEQQLQARRVLRAGGAAQRAPVVGVGACGEQQGGEARLVGDARRAVQRAHAVIPVVLPDGVGVGAGAQQRLRAGDEAIGALAAEEGGVRDVEQRLPPAQPKRPQRPARIARQRRGHALGVAEHQRGVKGDARQRGVEREQRLGIVTPPAGRPLHQRAGALVASHVARLRLAHERGPAARAELAGDRQLRIGEPQRVGVSRRAQPEHALARRSVACARRGQ
jgi:hypothetical protein